VLVQNVCGDLQSDALSDSEFLLEQMNNFADLLLEIVGVVVVVFSLDNEICDVFIVIAIWGVAQTLVG
jgi:hypothetical protein